MAQAIHGNKTQGQRKDALDRFRVGKIKVLVATDVASRGIDIPKISHVFNYDLPEEAESYIHRIGRAGESGEAISICSPEEMYLLRDIDRLVVSEDRMRLWNTIAMPQLLKNVKIGDINHISFGRQDAGGTWKQRIRRSFPGCSILCKAGNCSDGSPQLFYAAAEGGQCRDPTDET